MTVSEAAGPVETAGGGRFGLGPLRQRGVRRVLAAEFVSSLGTQMTTLALPWFVLVTTGSPARMGLVFVIQILPIALFGLSAGILVARWGALRITVVGDLANAALIASVPLLHIAGLLPFWTLLLIVAGTGTVAAAYLPAQRLLLSEVVGDDPSAAMAGNAFFETATSGARLIGPAVAGGLIGLIGTLNVLWIDAGTFVVSALLLLGLPRRAAAAPPESFTGEMKAGVRYMLRDKVIRTLSIAALGYGLLMPFVLLSLPVLAKVRYDADPHVAGALLAAWGGGTVAGTLVVATLARRVAPVVLGSIGGVGVALPLWLMPLDQPAVTVALAVAASCAFLPAITAPAITLMTTRPPEHLRPYVMPVFATAAMLAGPLAYAAAGLLFERFRPGPVLLGVAAGASLCALLLLSLTRHRAD
ncbi:MFS transporter [Streptomyces sp. NBC_01803]|uniref:MFS transporter n=1 Tax=Streptomyces sp. NBC_01803 TaxID=2975946 RepID=UPI002DDC84D2|nr:MFS transporter [Streptomyces sp. NBC_01803]WSA43057.1 MFS transporter [Streptomyces sp. NBC_01803]